MSRPWRSADKPLATFDSLCVSNAHIDKLLAKRDKLREEERAATAALAAAEQAVKDGPDLDIESATDAHASGKPLPEPQTPALEEAARAAKAKVDAIQGLVVRLEDEIFEYARANAQDLLAQEEQHARKVLADLTEGIAVLLGKTPVFLEVDSNLNAARQLVLGNAPRKRQSDAVRPLEQAIRKVQAICLGIDHEITTTGSVVAGAMALRDENEARYEAQLEEGKTAHERKLAELARGDFYSDTPVKVDEGIQKKLKQLETPNA